MRTRLLNIVTIQLIFFACWLIEVNGEKLFKGSAYVYDYEGRVSTGIAEGDSKQSSGFTVRSQLKLYFKNNTLYLKFSDTKLGLLRSDNFFSGMGSPSSESEKEANKEIFINFEKPFAVFYEDGTMLSFYDPSGSMTNWRKAVVGLFHINLDASEEIDPSNHEISDEWIGGYCTAHCRITNATSVGTDEVFNVTIVREHDYCSSVPRYFFSSMEESEDCTPYDLAIMEPLTTLAQTQYEVKGNIREFTILKAQATSLITFSPFTSEGPTILSTATQTLRLVSETEEEAPFQIDPEEYGEIYTIAFELNPYSEVHDPSRDTYKPTTLKFENLEEELMPKLTNLVKDYKDSEKKPESLMAVIEILHQLESKDFQNVFNKYVSIGEAASDDEKTIRNMLLEVLPYLGTVSSVTYMLDLIFDGKLDKPTATEMMYKFPFYIKELDYNMNTTLKRLLDKKEMEKYLTTWNVGVLAYGNVMHKACEEDLKEDSEEKNKDFCLACTEELAAKILTLAPKNSKDAIVYSLAYPNTEYKGNSELYDKVVKNEDYPIVLRLPTEWAVENNSVSNPYRSVFFDQNADYNQRIFAFEYLFFNTEIPEFYSELILILEKESNEKVASYIYSLLSTVAYSNDPCMQSWSENAKYVLKLAKPPPIFDVTKHSSKTFFLDTCPKFNGGQRTEIGVVPSNNFRIPREFYFIQSFFIMGRKLEIIEFQLLSNGDPELESKQNEDNEVNYVLVVRMFGKEVKLSRQLGGKDVNELILQGRNAVIDINVNSFAEVEYILPNIMGFPVRLALRAPYTLYVNGTVNMEADNNKVDVDVSLRVHIQAEMTVDAQDFGIYGIRQKIKANMNFPIKGTLGRAPQKIPALKVLDVLQYDAETTTIMPE